MFGWGQSCWAVRGGRPGEGCFSITGSWILRGLGRGALAAIRRFHEVNDAGIGGGRCAIVVGEGRSEAWGQLWERGRRAKVSNVVRVFEEMEAAIGWVSGSEDVC